MPAFGGVSTAPPSRGDNRFYVSPAMRKYKKPPKNQQEHQDTPHARQSKADKKPPPQRDQSQSSIASCSVSGRFEKKSQSQSQSPGASSSSSASTNLDRFLEHTIPAVPARFPPKSAVAKRNRAPRSHPLPFFFLGDLWDFFKEWSVYGAGVPIILKDGEPIVQYYAPTLSGIQIYIDPQRHDLESDAGPSRTSNEQERLVFQYMEHNNPYIREPLSDKAAALASQFPQLKTYRSCDLTPSSWVSVAWYPIYGIPMGLDRPYLGTSFLTFHCLSTPSGEGAFAREVRLPAFGLACYKFKVWFWNPDHNPKLGYLFERANLLLRRLQVHLPDFSYFVTHGTDQS